MLPEDIDFLARKERQKDLLREIERERHLQLMKHTIKKRKIFRKLAGWLGDYMMRWGSKLQTYSTTSSSQKGI